MASSDDGMVKYAVSTDTLTKQAQGLSESGHVVDCRDVNAPLDAENRCSSCGAKISR